MGKAAKWFRGFLGLKKPDSSPAPTPPAKPQKEKRRWSFVKSYREKDDHHHRHHNNHHSATKIGGAELRPAASGGAISCTQPLRGDDDSSVDPNKHAIAVAAATAAVAEAAVAAAHAAAAVVRLTSSGRCASVTPAAAYGSGAREEWLAAVKIQSAFRGFLARKALRALKGLVRLQALVRGHIERKRRLRRMHALLRAQARARAGRSQMSESSQSSSKSSQAHYTDPATPEKSEHVIRVKSSKYDQFSTLKRNSSNFRVPGTDQDRAISERNRSDRYATGIADDERTDKILEIDTGKQNNHHSTTKRRNLYPLSSDQNSHSFTTSKDSTAHQTLPSLSSHEVQSLTPLKFPHEEDDNSPFCTADNSPQFFSASSKGGSSRRSPFTPSKSDGTRSYLSGYSDHPNYMAYTESSRAKARSLSAPKQRPHVDRSGSSKRNSIHGFGESRSGSLKVSVSALQANFTNKAYPGSGRLDRLGMPVGYKY